MCGFAKRLGRHLAAAWLCENPPNNNLVFVIYLSDLLLSLALFYLRKKRGVRWGWERKEDDQDSVVCGLLPARPSLPSQNVLPQVWRTNDDEVAITSR